MASPPPLNLGLIDGIPARELLEGLGNLHQSVVVTGAEGVVLWASRALNQRFVAGTAPEGTHLADVCAAYLHSDSAVGPVSSEVALRRQIDSVLRQVAGGDCVYHHPVGQLASVGTEELLQNSQEPDTRSLEISTFSVKSCAAQLGNSRDQSAAELSAELYVTILRSAAKTAVSSSPDAESDNYFRGVFDQLPEATLVIDQSGFITYANARTIALLGKSVPELIDTPVSLYFPMSAILPQGTATSAAAKPVQPASTTDPTVVELVPQDAPAVYVEVSSRTLTLSDGTEAGRILQLHDTTSQQRVKEHFKQKIAALESYVHTVSHDLRSPLVSLLGFTRLMKQHYGKLLDETGHRFLEHIEQSGKNMNTMTKDLLELSTREPSSMTQKAVDPRNILLQIQAEMKPRLEDRGVQLDLPPAPPMIQCDRTQLYQIFSNLIGNALSHMGQCEDPRIEIDVEERDGERVIVVRDHGCGIEPGEQEQIFKAFHSRARDGGSASTGVGLAIVQKIAKAHGGHAWVESEPGRGAAFFVSIEHR